jgi:hypothetical protein
MDNPHRITGLIQEVADEQSDPALHRRLPADPSSRLSNARHPGPARLIPNRFRDNHRVPDRLAHRNQAPDADGKQHPRPDGPSG